MQHANFQAGILLLQSAHLKMQYEVVVFPQHLFCEELNKSITIELTFETTIVRLVALSH
jgi:hypothetical protein